MASKAFMKILSMIAPYLDFRQSSPRHGEHSKRPESCKAELMNAAVAKAFAEERQASGRGALMFEEDTEFEYITDDSNNAMYPSGAIDGEMTGFIPDRRNR